MSEKNELAERIEGNLIMRPFFVSACPLTVHDSFTKLAKDEYGDSYAMTIKGLLDAHKKLSAIEFIFKEVDNLWVAIEELKTVKQDEPLQAVVKRFGGEEK